MQKSNLKSADGGPPAVVIDGADTHDSQLLETIMNAIASERIEPENMSQNLYPDKGYDNPSDEKRKERRDKKRYPARRREVERTLS